MLRLLSVSFMATLFIFGMAVKGGDVVGQRCFAYVYTVALQACLVARFVLGNAAFQSHVVVLNNGHRILVL